MAKGIIYLMTTAVPGLVKIGKAGSANFEKRMYELEHNGYRNVTALKREFAIEVEDYDDKETLLHTIFEKSRVSDTELFALDKDIATQLLASFDGTVIYPKDETKENIFDNATDNTKGKLIPDGVYTFTKKKKSDNNKTVSAKAKVVNGNWILLKGSILGITEDAGTNKKSKKVRADLPLDSKGKLLEDFELGVCSPSFAGEIVMNQSINGWTDWHTKDGSSIDIYRKKEVEE